MWTVFNLEGARFRRSAMRRRRICTAIHDGERSRSKAYVWAEAKGPKMLRQTISIDNMHLIHFGSNAVLGMGRTSTTSQSYNVWDLTCAGLQLGYGRLRGARQLSGARTASSAGRWCGLGGWSQGLVVHGRVSADATWPYTADMSTRKEGGLCSVKRPIDGIKRRGS